MSWKDEAARIADIYGVDRTIVLATIQHETGGKNELGDSGRAFGYGQVWLKWHYDNLVKVASDMGIKVPPRPTSEAEEQKFKPLILGNNELSMRLAVYTIKKMWDASGHNFDSFTHMYVGQGVSDAVVEQRRKIYQSYGGQVSGFSTQTGSGIDGAGMAVIAGAGVLLLIALVK